MAAALFSILTGILASFIFEQFYRKRMRPAYYKLKSKDYEEPENIITEIAFWNEGRETIQGANVNPKNPTRILWFGEPNSFQAKNSPKVEIHLESDYPNNGFGVEEFIFEFESNSEFYCVYSAEIRFIELKNGEGVIMKVIHPSRSEIDFIGAIIGYGNIKEEEINPSNILGRFRNSRFYMPITIFYMFSVLLSYYCLLLYFILFDFLGNEAKFESILSFLGLVGIYGVLLVSAFTLTLKILQRIRFIPIEIRNYFSD